MKLLKFLVVSLFLFNFGLESIESGSNQQKYVLPEMPYKKSLILTSVLLFNSPHKDVEFVKLLISKMSNYEILESQAESIIEPLRSSRKAYKQILVKTVFKDDADLLNVTQQLKEDTDEITSHNIEELHRDKLIKFNSNVSPVFGSEQYKEILYLAKKYQLQQFELQKHPLFQKLETARSELKPLMYEFLRQNYSSLLQLQEGFNEPVTQVNNFLNAMIEKELYQPPVKNSI